MHRSMGEAISNILRRPLRTGLTVLGIVIGAGATERLIRLSDGRIVSDARRGRGEFGRALNGDGDGNSLGGSVQRRVWARLGELVERARGR